MKKTFFAFLMVLVCAVGALFATPLIDAAKNQDYKTFEKLVKKGSSLSEKNEAGMNVQIALAYFNPADFKKACTLLDSKGFDFDVPVENNVSLVYILAYSCSYEKLEVLLNYKIDVNRKNSITGLTPIEATQFSTFKYYSEQKIDSKAFERAEKTRKLLREHGAIEFKYSPTTMGNFGNVFFCFYNSIKTLFPRVTMSMMNTEDAFDFSEVNGQYQATFREQKVHDVIKLMKSEAEINNYTESDVILKKLVEIKNAEESYVVIAQTGNNPVAPNQWVIVAGMNFSKKPSKNDGIETFSPDGVFQFIDYQVKDISHLITMRLLSDEEIAAKKNSGSDETSEDDAAQDVFTRSDFTDSFYVLGTDELRSFIWTWQQLKNYENDELEIDDGMLASLYEEMVGRDEFLSMYFETFFRNTNNPKIQKQIAEHIEKHGLKNRSFEKALLKKINSTEKKIGGEGHERSIFVYGSLLQNDAEYDENITLYDITEIKPFNDEFGTLFFNADWSVLQLDPKEGEAVNARKYFFAGGDTNSIYISFEEIENVGEIKGKEEVIKASGIMQFAEHYGDDWHFWELSKGEVLETCGVDNYYVGYGIGSDQFIPEIVAGDFVTVMYKKETNKLYIMHIYMNFSKLNMNYEIRNRIYNYVLFFTQFCYCE
ncbi:hypothetical protein [Treponema sp.]|uniref:hypothetical protein n=1 Tax=Treponema sp. TaxID=166 RepID=UPI00298D6E26|nr:hypothetical protein [Treponema sp.]MCR5612497.1 ankyrin repeat domain-containing protein [Treponema sp.]